jgi:hypothetical protein
MFKTLLLTAAAFLALTGQAKADHIEDHDFLRVTTSLTEAQSQTVYDRNQNLSQLSIEQIAQFTQIAKSQAEIWGDTILEGDYQADGRTVVDRVDALSVDGRLIAYRLTYSERSWDTSTCTFPGNRDGSALDQCQEGRIIETSFVSPDLASWTRDPQNFAFFEEHH